VSVSFFDTFYVRQRRKENEEKSFAAAKLAAGGKGKAQKNNLYACV